MDALISVIVPIYKVEAYLPRCLDSIVNQTYRNLEIILVDDGSPDGCGAICDEYAKRDARIRVIHKKNGGVSSARNAGLDIMRGEYLMFVDPDDWISQDAVQVLYDRLIQDGSDMAVGKHTDAYEDGTQNDSFCKWMKDAYYSVHEFIGRKTDSHYIPVSSWGKLIKSDVYINIRFPEVRHAEDLMVFPVVLENMNKISTVDYLVYYYFQRENSMTHSMNEDARKECLQANLLMTKYLVERQCLGNAPQWFGRCIMQAIEMQNKIVARSMAEEILGHKSCMELLNKQGWRKRIKWYALGYPVLMIVIRKLERIIRRK